MPKKCKNGGGRHQKNRSKKKITIEPWGDYLKYRGGVGLLGANKGNNRYEITPLGSKETFITRSCNEKKIGRIDKEKKNNYVLFTKETNKYDICVLFTPDRYSECPEASAIIRDYIKKDDKDDEVSFGKGKQCDESSSDEEFSIDFI